MRDVAFPVDHPAALLYASRQRWLSMVAGLALVLTVLGGCYLLGLFTVARDSRPYAVVQYLPGGMHTHGAIMLALGAASSFMLSPTFRGQPERDLCVGRVCVTLPRLLQFVVGPYLAWTSVAFLAAPLTHGTWNLGWVWPAFGAFTAYLLAVRRYPTWSEVDEWIRRSQRSSG